MADLVMLTEEASLVSTIKIVTNSSTLLTMLNSEQGVQLSDTTENDSSNIADNKKIFKQIV
jgi:hypothetical protein